MEKEKLTSLKKNIELNTVQEIVGTVVYGTNKIENILNEIILEKVKPQEVEVFRKVFLNSSIIGYAAKAKILINLFESIPKDLYNKLMSLGSIRNGFAHTVFENKMTITVDKGIVQKPVSSQFISVMNSSGKVIEKDIETYYNEFKKLYLEVEQDLRKL